MKQIVPVFGKRYLFEHKYLPQMINKWKEDFIQPLMEDKNLLSELFNEFCTQIDGIGSPYSKEEFSTHVVDYGDDVLCVALAFPDPESSPLCRNVFVFFTTGCNDLCYYTLERAQEESEPEEYSHSFICAWFEGAHFNFGRHRVDSQEAMDTCYELFLGSQYARGYLSELDKCRNTASHTG